AAGEDHIGPLQEKVLVASKVRRRKPETRKLVHAVVDNCHSIDVGRDRIQHRCVEPKDRPCLGRVDLKQLVEQRRQRSPQALARKGLRYPGAYCRNSRIFEKMEFEVGRVMLSRNMFFEKEY